MWRTACCAGSDGSSLPATPPAPLAGTERQAELLRSSSVRTSASQIDFILDEELGVLLEPDFPQPIRNRNVHRPSSRFRATRGMTPLPHSRTVGRQTARLSIARDSEAARSGLRSDHDCAICTGVKPVGNPRGNGFDSRQSADIRYWPKADLPEEERAACPLQG